MTDNEIIKALECCKNGQCADCPRIYTPCEIFRCKEDLISNALDLINRQQAHIEQLKENIDGLKIGKANIIRDIQFEAIKEFAERLKTVGKQEGAYDYVSLWDIDNLVKEMVGDAE